MRSDWPVPTGIARPTARPPVMPGAQEAEGWDDWWVAIKAEPEFAGAIAERESRSSSHSGRPDPGLAAHLDALAAAGFGSAGTVWQYGQRRILAALR
jgi:hypothetical protein